jgi:signal peptidase II
MGDLMKWKLVVLMIILVLIDQVSKFLVVQHMHLYQQIVIIKDFFSLNFVYNEGAAFSLLSGHTLLFYIFSIMTLVILGYYFINSERFSLLLALAIVISGTLGNLIDRLLYHKVVDFLSFTFLKQPLAIFNFADICVSVGVILLIVDIMANDHKRSK